MTLHLGVIEIDDAIPGGGQFLSDWINACGADKVRVGYVFLSGGGTAVTVQQSINESDVIAPNVTVGTGATGQADAPLSARFFRVRVDGSASTPFQVSIKEVP